MDSEAVPVGSVEEPPRAALGSEHKIDSERDTTRVNVVSGRNPGGLDLPAPQARPYANETIARPRASTPFVVPRPTPITHTDVTEARPSTMGHEIETEPRRTNEPVQPKPQTFKLVPSQNPTFTIIYVSRNKRKRSSSIQDG